MVKHLLRNFFSGETILHLEKFEEGYNNTAYDVTMSSGEYILKVLRHQPAKQWAQKHEEVRERVQAKYPDFSMARMLHVDFDCETPHCILQKLPGVSLKSAYETIENKDELFFEIGRRYGQLHSIKFNFYGDLDKHLKLENTYDNWLDKCKQKFEKAVQKCRERSLLSEDFLQCQIDYYHKYSYLLEEETSPCLTHGDSSLSNIIVRKVDGAWQLSGFIDFEFASSGGAVYDLFKSLRTYRQKLENAKSLIRGHNQIMQLSKKSKDLGQFYAWLSLFVSIPGIHSLQWEGLSEKKTVYRRKKIFEETIEKLENLVF